MIIGVDKSKTDSKQVKKKNNKKHKRVGIGKSKKYLQKRRNLESETFVKKDK